MRVILDNHKSYDLVAMFKPLRLKRAEAWGNFRANLNAWPNAVKIPFQNKATLKGCVNWLLLILCHTFSLMLLPLFCCFGYSTKAYAFFTQSDAEKMKQYKRDLEKVYSELSGIKDAAEYQLRLKEEIKRIKPF